MLTDEELTNIVRNELAAELTNVNWSPQLLASVHRRHAQRRRVKASVTAVVAVAVGVAIAIPVADSGRGPAPRSLTAPNRSGHVSLTGEAVSLAGYKTDLPTGYTVADASTGTQCSNFFVPVGVPPAPGSAAPSPQDFSQLALQANGSGGCLAFGLSGNYGQSGSSAAVTDPVAPSGSETTTIGAYQASTYQAPNSPTVAVYVQIPTTGGGDHDLIVAAQGITQPDLIAMIQKGLPTQVTPAPASGWSHRNLDIDNLDIDNLDIDNPMSMFPGWCGYRQGRGGKISTATGARAGFHGDDTEIMHTPSSARFQTPQA